MHCNSRRNFLFHIELDELKKQSPGSKKKKQTQLSFTAKPGTSSQSNVKNISIQKHRYLKKKNSIIVTCF